MRFTWDERKARRNEREHGISFTLAERSLLRGLGVPIDEDLREGEWRTLIVAPLDSGNLIAIVVAIYEEDKHEHSTRSEEQTEAYKTQFEPLGRIISARIADKREQVLYFAHCPKDWF